MTDLLKSRYKCNWLSVEEAAAIYGKYRPESTDPRQILYREIRLGRLPVKILGEKLERPVRLIHKRELEEYLEQHFGSTDSDD